MEKGWDQQKVREPMNVPLLTTCRWASDWIGNPSMGLKTLEVERHKPWNQLQPAHHEILFPALSLPRKFRNYREKRNIFWDQLCWWLRCPTPYTHTTLFSQEMTVLQPPSNPHPIILDWLNYVSPVSRSFLTGLVQTSPVWLRKQVYSILWPLEVKHFDLNISEWLKLTLLGKNVLVPETLLAAAYPPRTWGMLERTSSSAMRSQEQREHSARVRCQGLQQPSRVDPGETRSLWVFLQARLVQWGAVSVLGPECWQISPSPFSYPYSIPWS